MSNALYPSLPGEAFPRVKLARFNTQKATSDSLRSWRVARALYPLYTYKLTYAFLDQTDFQTICAFFLARKGAFDTFLLDDRDDNTVTAPQTLGVGDGTTTKFQLLRTLSGVTGPVGPVNGVPVVRVNSVATALYTIDDYGLVTLNTAPPIGHVVDWTGQYYWRCCFTKDEHEYSEFVRQLRELKSVEMETEKP